MTRSYNVEWGTVLLCSECLVFGWGVVRIKVFEFIVISSSLHAKISEVALKRETKSGKVQQKAT
jgi:hypothetical protein